VVLGVPPETKLVEEVGGQAVERRLLAAGGQRVEPAQFCGDVELGPGVGGDEQRRLVERDLLVGPRHQRGKAGRGRLVAVRRPGPLRHLGLWAWASASSKLVLAARSLR